MDRGLRSLYHLIIEINFSTSLYFYFQESMHPKRCSESVPKVKECFLDTDHLVSPTGCVRSPFALPTERWSDALCSCHGALSEGPAAAPPGPPLHALFLRLTRCDTRWHYLWALCFTTWRARGPWHSFPRWQESVGRKDGPNKLLSGMKINDTFCQMPLARASTCQEEDN